MLRWMWLILLCGCDGGRAHGPPPIVPSGWGFGTVIVDNDPQSTHGYARFASGVDNSRERETLRGLQQRFGSAYAPDECMTIGECVSCRYVDIAPIPDEVSAGDVYVDVVGGSFRLSYFDENGGYATFASPSSTPWGGGNPITVATNGGAVPSFVDQLIAPTPLPTVSAVGAGGPFVDRTQTLALKWPAQPTQDTVVVVLSGEHPFTSARCSFPVDAGTALVPSEVLMTFAKGAAWMTVSTARQRDLDAGDYQVTLLAEALARDGGGASLVLE